MLSKTLWRLTNNHLVTTSWNLKISTSNIKFITADVYFSEVKAAGDVCRLAISLMSWRYQMFMHIGLWDTAPMVYIISLYCWLIYFFIWTDKHHLFLLVRIWWGCLIWILPSTFVYSSRHPILSFSKLFKENAASDSIHLLDFSSRRCNCHFQKVDLIFQIWVWTVMHTFWQVQMIGKHFLIQPTVHRQLRKQHVWLPGYCRFCLSNQKTFSLL